MFKDKKNIFYLIALICSIVFVGSFLVTAFLSPDMFNGPMFYIFLADGLITLGVSIFLLFGPRLTNIDKYVIPYILFEIAMFATASFEIYEIIHEFINGPESAIQMVYRCLINITLFIGSIVALVSTIIFTKTKDGKMLTKMSFIARFLIVLALSNAATAFIFNIIYCVEGRVDFTLIILKFALLALEVAHHQLLDALGDVGVERGGREHLTNVNALYLIIVYACLFAIVPTNLNLVILRNFDKVLFTITLVFTLINMLTMAFGYVNEKIYEKCFLVNFVYVIAMIVIVIVGFLHFDYKNNLENLGLFITFNLIGLINVPALAAIFSVFFRKRLGKKDIRDLFN